MVVDDREPQLLIEEGLEVNGHRYQAGSTKTMVFDVAYLVYYLSQFLVLEPEN